MHSALHTFAGEDMCPSARVCNDMPRINDGCTVVLWSIRIPLGAQYFDSYPAGVGCGSGSHQQVPAACLLLRQT
eukprot:3952659-Amphidinium_carterae.1